MQRRIIEINFSNNYDIIKTGRGINYDEFTKYIPFWGKPGRITEKNSKFRSVKPVDTSPLGPEIIGRRKSEAQIRKNIGAIAEGQIMKHRTFFLLPPNYVFLI
jgi:hypothetical protein